MIHTWGGVARFAGIPSTLGPRAMLIIVWRLQCPRRWCQVSRPGTQGAMWALETGLRTLGRVTRGRLAEGMYRLPASETVLCAIVAPILSVTQQDVESK